MENKYDISKIRKKLLAYIKIFLEITKKNYCYYYESSGDRRKEKIEGEFNKINKEFVKSEEVKNLYTVLQMIYKFFIYSEWVDKNLKLIEKK